MYGRQLIRSFLLAISVVLACNCLFLLFSVYIASLSSAPVAEQVRLGFDRGYLVEEDWLDDDTARGSNQYNDCMVLQMAINHSNGTFEKSLAPKIYVLDDSYRGGCTALRRIAAGVADIDKLFSDTYARYWHGYVPVASTLLRLTDVSGLRRVLKAFVFFSLSMLLIAAVTAREPFLIFGSTVALTGATVWALPYYGQGLSYAPGDGIVLFGVASLIFARRWLSNMAILAACCAGYGAWIAYFDFLTGQLPTAAGFVFVGAYLLGTDSSKSDMRRRPWAYAFAALFAVIFGAVSTVVIKQAVVYGLIGEIVVERFTNNLLFYIGATPGPESFSDMYFQPFKRLFEHSFVLTYNNGDAGLTLLIASCLAWLGAATLAIRCKNRQRIEELLAYFAGALAAPAWVLLMPRHTTVEAAFMVRILIVPIALGWAVFLSQLRYARLSNQRSRYVLL